jgi:hypothetical protein
MELKKVILSLLKSGGKNFEQQKTHSLSGFFIA